MLLSTDYVLYLLEIRTDNTWKFFDIIVIQKQKDDIHDHWYEKLNKWVFTFFLSILVN